MVRENEARPHELESSGKILIVDDDPAHRRLLTRALTIAGYEAVEVESGKVALEKYSEYRPDLVLLDIEMPGIDGFETCRLLRAQNGEACVPIIFTSVRPGSEDGISALAAGGVDFLTAPLQADEALARIGSRLFTRRLMEEQKELVSALSRANASKNKFIGMAAHDLRNPLASVRGLAEMLLEGVVGSLNADQADLVDTMRAASDGMLDMVNELLDVATIEAGELKMVMAPVNLAEVIERAVYLNNINAAKKKTQIVVTKCDLPGVAYLDAAKIKQVLDNLLSNAVKFSPPGSCVGVEAVTIEDRVSIAVKDQGPGIPDSELHKLFKDFGRTSVIPTSGRPVRVWGWLFAERLSKRIRA